MEQAQVIKAAGIGWMIVRAQVRTIKTVTRMICQMDENERMMLGLLQHVMCKNRLKNQVKNHKLYMIRINEAWLCKQESKNTKGNKREQQNKK